MFRSKPKNQQVARFGDIPFLAFLAIMAAFVVGLRQNGGLDATETSILTTIGMFGVLRKRQNNADKVARQDAPQLVIPKSGFRSLDK